MAPASAQRALSAKGASISYAEGRVSVEGNPVAVTPTRWPQIPDGQSIRTGRGSRAEVLLNACTVLHLDENSVLRMLGNRLDDTRVELVSGSAFVEADVILKDTRVTVTTGGVAAPVSRAGLYRFDAAPPTVKVFAGKITAGGTTVGAKRVQRLGGGASEKFKADRRSDAFGRWSERRIGVLAALSGQRDKDARDALRAAANNTRVAVESSNPRALDDERLTGLSAPSIVPTTRVAERVRICSGAGW
jgi:hypothetical protein